MDYQDIMISDFSDVRFQQVFRQYFSELGMNIRNWDALFAEMNSQKGNTALLRINTNGEVIGFLQFQPGEMNHWFFREPIGFIREFWVAESYRGEGHGRELLELTENFFREHKISRSILTADDAEDFYLRCGYRKESRIIAKNNMDVFVKQL